MLLTWEVGYLDDVLRVQELVHVQHFQKPVPNFLGEELRVLVLLIWVVRILRCITVLEFGHMPLLKLSDYLVSIRFSEVGKLQFVNLSYYLFGSGSVVRIVLKTEPK